jgi:hypothetical protein
MMFDRGGGRDAIEKGDQIRKTCSKCGEMFTRTEGTDDNVSRCKECYERYQELQDNYSLAAGTWRVGNDELREAVQELVETEFGFHTYVEGSDLYIFEDE